MKLYQKLLAVFAVTFALQGSMLAMQRPQTSPQLLTKKRRSLELKRAKLDEALRLAADRGYKDLMKEIIEAGGDVNYYIPKQNITLLDKAAQNFLPQGKKGKGDPRFLEVIKLLASYGARESKRFNFIKNQDTSAAYNRGKKEYRPGLIDLDVVEKQKHLNPALLEAVNVGDIEIFDYLKSAGADIDMLDYGRPAVLLRARDKYEEAKLKHKPKYLNIIYIWASESNIELNQIWLNALKAYPAIYAAYENGRKARQKTGSRSSEASPKELVEEFDEKPLLIE